MKIQHQADKINPSKQLWNAKWGYRESFIIVICIVVAGMVFGILFRGSRLTSLSFPTNVYLASVFLLLIVILHIFYRKRPFILWLSGIPAAVSSISLFAFLVLVMGIVSQDQTSYPSKFLLLTGFYHVQTSWMFFFSLLYLLLVLGMVALRRAFPFSLKNLGFFLNHAGLWIILTGATLGSGDIKRLNINLLKEGQESNIGISERGEMVKLPFTLKLIDFKIDEYAPKLALVDIRTGEYLRSKGTKFPSVEKNMQTKIGKWQIRIDEYLPQALIRDSAMQNSSEPGNYPAAHVIATNLVTKISENGWISSGSYLQSPVYLPLDSGNVLFLGLPEPKKFSSVMEIITDSIKADTVTIEVNKPYNLNHWKIYQIGYDQSKGKWSSLSVLEAVNDPWLPLVYAGFCMLMAGSVFLFWKGKVQSEKQSH